MSSLARLAAANNLSDIANLINLKPAVLSFILYKIPSQKKYRTFYVPKSQGGLRSISAPDDRLKMAQSRMAHLLQECHDELLSKENLNRECLYSHGFQKKLSIHTNASKHTGKRHVLNIDLEDFFGSINFGRVRGFLITNRHFRLRPPAATVIAQIVCYQNSLPQGAPTSPVMSNLIASVLDIHLGTLASQQRTTYTRYADDITFSTNERVFPEKIARGSSTKPQTWVVGDAVRSRVFRAGFRLNHKKTRMQLARSRQDVTGLVVNDHLNVRTQYYKRARAMCHNLFTHGFAYRKSDRAMAKPNQIRGQLSFIFYTKTRDGLPENVRQDHQKRGYHRLYKQFLDYVTFYERQRPIIIGEGKTDSAYIECAIRSLVGLYPRLAENVLGNFVRHVDFFRYSETARIVQDLGGGEGDLCYLLNTYQQRTKSFLAPATRQPAIVIADNDDAGKKVFAAASTLAKTKIDGSMPFYHLHHNLYLVPIPRLSSGAPTVIEDLFDASTLSTVFDGKTFSKDEQADKTKYFGKHIFAERVVRPKCLSINFDNFKPVLGGLRDAIDHYDSIR